MRTLTAPSRHVWISEFGLTPSIEDHHIRTSTWYQVYTSTVPGLLVPGTHMHSGIERHPHFSQNVANEKKHQHHYHYTCSL